MAIEFSDKELAALKREYASNATDEQFTLWIEMCKRRNLVPVEDVVLQLRSVQETEDRGDLKVKVWVKKVVFITTLRALLKLAERTGKYKGFVPAQYIYLDPETKRPTIVSEFPLPDPKDDSKPLTPWAAKVGVKRAGFDEPQFEIARFWAYAQTYKDGGISKLNSTWTTRGPEQLVKCAKAAAVRGAFPEELGGLFLEEEIQNEESAPKTESTKPEPQKSTAPAVTPAAPKVNHTPAEGKVAPRPGEEERKVDTTSPVPSTSDQTTTVPAAAAALNLPDYHPPLTVEGKIEHSQQAQEALNKATAPETKTEPKTADKKKTERKSTAKKEKPKTTAADPNKEPKVDPPPAATPAPAPATAPVVENQDADPPPETNPLPTKEEFNKIVSRLVAFRDRLGGAGSESSKKLKEFILKQTNTTDTKFITSKQWEGIFKTLDSALDDADLKSIVSK